MKSKILRQRVRFFSVSLAALVVLLGATGLLEWMLGAEWLRLKRDAVYVLFGVWVVVLSCSLLFAALAAWYAIRLARATEKHFDVQKQYASLVQTAQDAIISADSQGNIVQFNMAGMRIFGYSVSEAIGRPITLLIPERFHPAHLQGFSRYLATREAHIVGKTVELLARRKDGSEFPIELSLASWETNATLFFTAIIRDVSERKQTEHSLKEAKENMDAANRLLQRQAKYDFLTGLYNRLAILEAMRKVLAEARRESEPTSIIMADLDYFKNINDSYGHLFGDHVLAEVSKRLQLALRPCDRASRFGGDEFLVLLPGASLPETWIVAEKIRETISLQPVSTESDEIQITISLGILTCAPHKKISVEKLIAIADQALYSAKRDGRNRTVEASLNENQKGNFKFPRQA